jgi:copper homeostasis protein
MPGGGINAENAGRFKEKGFNAVHLSGARYGQRLSSKPKVSMNSPLFLSDEGVFSSDFDVIRNVVKEVK